jgi:hypothetical protein
MQYKYWSSYAIINLVVWMKPSYFSFWQKKKVNTFFVLYFIYCLFFKNLENQYILKDGSSFAFR